MDHYVCKDCLDDDALIAIVEANAEETTCDYCKKESADGSAIAAPTDIVFEAIQRGIQREYTDPADELPYESREGGYQGTVYSASEIIDEVGPISDKGALIDDLRSYLDDTWWCKIDYFRLRDDESMTLSWHSFEEGVKHHTRYFFLEPGEKSDDPWDEISTPAQTLDNIARGVSEAGIIKRVPAGAQYFRARIHTDAEKVETAASLGAPPIEKARFANRMSPAGVSMFYGAEHRETAIAEIFDPERAADPKTLTTGAFNTTRDLYLLDMAPSFFVPSLFDDEKHHLRHRLMFLWKFLRDFCKPIEKDGREHIEYVPTQVVTEFFRHRYRVKGETRLDGIRYNSAQHKRGICVVLFVDNDGCGDTPDDGEDIALVLDRTSLIHEPLRAPHPLPPSTLFP